MAKVSEEILVDETKYAVTQYSAGKSLRLLTTLAKVMGEPISIITGSGLDAKVGPELIGSAIKSLANSASPTEIESLAKAILEGVIIYSAEGHGRQINFDLDFAGKIGHLFKVLKAVLAFQYSDFLAGLADVMPEPAAKDKQVTRVKAL